ILRQGVGIGAGWQLDLAQLLARGRLPDADGAVLAPGRQRLAVRGIAYLRDGRTVPTDGNYLLAGRRLQQANGVSLSSLHEPLPAHGQEPPVGRKRHARPVPAEVAK